MTLNGAIMQLVEMRENSMMPEVFKPYFDKVIETVSECEEPNTAQPNVHDLPKDADCIYRQAAIDALDCINGTEEVLRSLPPAQTAQPEITPEQIKEYCRKRFLVIIDGLYFHDLQMKAAKESNRRQIKTPAWNSGKFPEESGTYTVTAYDGVTTRVTYAKYHKRLKQWELTGARAYWRVIAWMPLPEPYKGGPEG